MLIGRCPECGHVDGLGAPCRVCNHLGPPGEGNAIFGGETGFWVGGVRYEGSGPYCSEPATLEGVASERAKASIQAWLEMPSTPASRKAEASILSTVYGPGEGPAFLGVDSNYASAAAGLEMRRAPGLDDLAKAMKELEALPKPFDPEHGHAWLILPPGANKDAPEPLESAALQALTYQVFAALIQVGMKRLVDAHSLDAVFEGNFGRGRRRATIPLPSDHVEARGVIVLWTHEPWPVPKWLAPSFVDRDFGVDHTVFWTRRFRG
jgi:hypothetical protein